MGNKYNHLEHIFDELLNLNPKMSGLTFSEEIEPTIDVDGISVYLKKNIVWQSVLDALIDFCKERNLKYYLRIKLKRIVFYIHE